jgi:hypothetical protein
MTLKVKLTGSVVRRQLTEGDLKQGKRPATRTAALKFNRDFASGSDCLVDRIDDLHIL